MAEPRLIYSYIDNKYYKGGSTDRFGDVFNPAEGKISGKCVYADDKTLAVAIQSAQAGFEKWSATSVVKRSHVMFAMRNLLLERKRDVAEILGQEHGKTIDDALGEIQRGIDVLEFSCGIPHLIKGEYNHNIGGDIDLYSLREPVGVVAGITPFNFPCMIPLWMGAMAVACGNAYINKPSERDPSTALMLAELWTEAGLPDGVWNSLMGDAETVTKLIEHPGVQAVSFVGSTAIGEIVYHKSSLANKRVQTFCGAKNHAIILPDADVDKAVDGLVGAAYGSAGERCMSISVAVLVGDETAEKILPPLIERSQQTKVGVYNDPKAHFGPLITKDAQNRVERLIESGVKAGAHLLLDGRRVSVPQYKNGFFVGATLVDNVTKDMEIYKEEVFGPVLCIMRVKTLAEAVEAVNNNEYGNGVAIYTSNGGAARDFIKNVDIGMIGVNVPIPVPMAFHNFGGAKRSKFGDTLMHGPESVKFFTKIKTISSRWPENITQGAIFSLPTAH